MTIIQEGALRFTFDATAEVSKYDAWSFYRNQFQNGCYLRNKAVDFLCLAGKDAWLIEVRDYREHIRTKAIDLADELAIKVRDTLAGLVAAQTQANATEEKNFARKWVRVDRFRVACHVEQPSKTSRLRPRAIEPDKLQDQLRRLLKAIDPHPKVLDTFSTSADLPWRTTSAAKGHS